MSKPLVPGVGDPEGDCLSDTESDWLCSLQGVMEDGIRSGETSFSSDSATCGLGALTLGVLGLSNLTLLGPEWKCRGHVYKLKYKMYLSFQ